MTPAKPGCWPTRSRSALSSWRSAQAGESHDLCGSSRPCLDISSRGPRCARCARCSLTLTTRQTPRGEPELAVLVVHQSDGLPGQGWWVSSATRHGFTGLWEGTKAANCSQAAQAGVRVGRDAKPSFGLIALA